MVENLFLSLPLAVLENQLMKSDARYHKTTEQPLTVLCGLCNGVYGL